MEVEDEHVHRQCVLLVLHSVRLPAEEDAEREGAHSEGQERLGQSHFFHTISARPPKQPLMVRTFLKVYTRPRLTYPLRCRGC